MKPASLRSRTPPVAALPRAGCVECAQGRQGTRRRVGARAIRGSHERSIRRPRPPGRSRAREAAGRDHLSRGRGTHRRERETREHDGGCPAKGSSDTGSDRERVGPGGDRLEDRQEAQRSPQKGLRDLGRAPEMHGHGPQRAHMEAIMRRCRTCGHPWPQVGNPPKACILCQGKRPATRDSVGRGAKKNRRRK
ncbi:MAG: hypothetical protein GY820_39475 [Gammaproteobacteria bacterium]|nr:hypothetical protein [Gammaproteobacteria bacterium]